MARSFYSAIERKDIDFLLSLFDESVDYHTDQYRGKAAVRDDYSRYFKRWPIASYTIGNIQLQRSTAPKTMVLLFDIQYALRNPAGKKRSTSGRATEKWVVERIGNVPKIISQSETIH